MENFEFNFDIDDFDMEDFDDPIKLLGAMKTKKNNTPMLSFDITDNCVVQNEKSDLSHLLTLDVAAQKLGLSREALHIAIVDGLLKCSAYIPLFTQEDLNSYMSAQKKKTTILFEEFMSNISSMRTLYSYKPILILALLSKADENGSATLDDVINFFFDFYTQRKKNGQTPEKNESYFVQYPADRKKAAHTILRYPVKIFSEKKFMYYDTSTQAIVLSPQIWSVITPQIRMEIEDICSDSLECYYSSIE